jgi:hypothetical protein
VVVIFSNARKLLSRYLFSVASRTTGRAFWLLSIGLHSCVSNCSWMDGWPSITRPVGSAENCALQYSQIPKTGILADRFTILRLRFAINTVSHKPGNHASLVDFKRHHYPKNGSLVTLDHFKNNLCYRIELCSFDQLNYSFQGHAVSMSRCAVEAKRGPPAPWTRKHL